MVLSPLLINHTQKFNILVIGECFYQP